MAVLTPPQGRVGWHHALLVLSALCLGALLGHLASEPTQLLRLLGI